MAIHVSDSGSADASGGGYANTGVHIGDVNLVTGMPVRTRYRNQVEAIARHELRDREAELAELAEFCTAPETAGSYVWWQADAWAGKSLLMSHFVLNPPAGVRIVSFFVTGQQAGQNNRAALTGNLVEQLLAMLGQPPPPYMPDSTLEGHLTGLIEEAAEACRRRGENFVLLVDGLDEDRGAHDGPSSHSIAAFLPETLRHGTRVIVAGRVNPPVPFDVKVDHPLRDPRIVRRLAPSPHADADKDALVREVWGLVDDGDIGRHLLGLLTAARGGLTHDDLVELTRARAQDIRSRLRTVVGRSFRVHKSAWLEHDVLALAHQELEVEARKALGGDRLLEYERALHEWAGRYRDRKWPRDTPEYLLHGYYSMLAATGDLPGTLGYVTDPRRYDRARVLSGGDGSALKELAEVHDSIARNAVVDLAAIARLAVHREYLETRNAMIPAGLPALWTLLGQRARAEALVGSVRTASWEKDASSAMAIAEATVGDVPSATHRAVSITDDWAKGHTLWRIAHLAAQAGDIGDAYRLAQSIDRGYMRMRALASVAKAAKDANEPELAAKLIEEAAPLVKDNMTGTAALDFAYALHTVGDREGARKCLGTYRFADIDGTYVVAGLVEATADVVDLDSAEQLAERITSADVQSVAFAVLAGKAFLKLDRPRASRLLARAEHLLPNMDKQPGNWVFTAIAKAMARGGDPTRAQLFLTEHTTAETQTTVLLDLAEFLASTGHIDRAEGLVHATGVPLPQHWPSLVRVACRIAAAGHPRRAEAIVNTITKPHDRAQSLIELAKHGDRESAWQWAREAEELIGPTAESHRHDAAISKAIHVITGKGDTAGTEELAEAITQADLRDKALADIAEAVTYSGDAVRGEAIALSISTLDGRARALGAVARADNVGTYGSIASPRLVLRPEDVTIRHWTAELSVVVATRTPDHARTFLTHIEDAISQATVTANQVEAMVRLVETAVRIPGWTDTTGLIDTTRQLVEPGSDHTSTPLFARLATAANSIGDHKLAKELYERALTAFASMPENRLPYYGAYPELVEAATALGDPAHAERLAQSASDPRVQAEALVGMARAADAGTASHIIARVVRLGDWTTPLVLPLWRRPDVVNAIVEETRVVREHDEL
ncbi:hypothetical protein [Kibdelosporangium phytohabitans]|uniref:Uncharacterized protein n=1 Tax=Kibdelosporangium phytohabitans TaxID=860235 RepID=A0A0N9HZ64_9PSEU|nr:hypothetical protein [Kibdelosporangium phytohabitans]ALG08689.1 hypothetical protein AOZ06_18770 [Kibdelosporangium phytohabitans]MBE1470205.1 hypothetical protein [Kibdelosporangium phytohabitans]